MYSRPTPVEERDGYWRTVTAMVLQQAGRLTTGTDQRMTSCAGSSTGRQRARATGWTTLMYYSRHNCHVGIHIHCTDETPARRMDVPVAGAAAGTRPQ